jgi:uncharacterized protein YmfQ (DUF2313 family)
MSDRSKIIRHPYVVQAEFQRITDRLAWLRNEMKDAEDELRQVTEVAMELMVIPDKPGPKPRRPRQPITEELLGVVAQAYREAAPGTRQAAVAEAIGLSTSHSASYYVNAARKAGLLGQANGDMRVEQNPTEVR